MNPVISSYIWPGQTHFGLGAAALAGPQAHALGGRHLFLLADPGVVSAGLLAAVLPALAQAGLSHTLYDRVVPNPDVVSVEAAVAAYRASDANLILGMGGGSALDTAKAVRLLAGSPAEVSIADYSFLRGGALRPLPLARVLPPLIAIPTTAGTGAEATPWGVITEPATKRKFGFGGPELLPTVALLDPEMTVGLPPFLTAATGFDALTHLIEAYVSTNNHQPALDPLILYGIELLSRSLRRAVAQGSDRQARSDGMQAALLGGIAISSNWLGACHALAHPLSGIANVQHGLANAIMLPHQMAYSLPAALERYARIATALDPAARAGGTLRQRAEQAIDLVRELLVDVNLPTRLRDVGVSEAMIGPLSEQAIGDGNVSTTPRPVTQAILADLYRAAL
jgi:alcohol dehydrogenase class IV